MGFTAFLAQTSPCFQYMFNPLLGNTLSSLSLLHSDTFLLTHFSHLQFSALHPKHQIPPLYTASEIRIPIQAAFQRPVTMTWGLKKYGEGEVIHSVSILSCSFKCACVSLYFSHKPAGLSTSLNLGIHVKKC